MELKSKTIPKNLIDGLVSVCDQELSKHIGNAQVIDNISEGVLCQVERGT